MLKTAANFKHLLCNQLSSKANSQENSSIFVKPQSNPNIFDSQILSLT